MSTALFANPQTGKGNKSGDSIPNAATALVDSALIRARSVTSQRIDSIRNAMAALRNSARRQRPSLRSGEQLDSVISSVTDRANYRINDSVPDSVKDTAVALPDTIELPDSAYLADDIPADLDTVPKPKKSRIVKEQVDLDHAVDFSAKDSLVMMGQSAAFMYGKSSVKYADIDLAADEIHMDMKESLVYAVGRRTLPTKLSARLCSRTRAVSMSRRQ